MKKLLDKMLIYGILILLSLEVWVRVLYLGKDTPVRVIDSKKVEKWAPNQNGYSVTGNRRQNFAEYRINNSGFNSYREFRPTEDKVEVALVGDSFIEGFHQPYYNSIGKKIEDKVPGIEVYEYGYAGYDFADQLHLINAYNEDFDLINYVVLGLKFSNDLKRDKYEIVEYRMALESPLYRTIRSSKLMIYAGNIGLFDPVRSMIGKIRDFGSFGRSPNVHEPIPEQDVNQKYLDNFEALVALYGYDKSRFYLLLDENKTPDLFLNYLNSNGFKYIPFGEKLDNTKRPTNLIYDYHWNNYGRILVAETIMDALNLSQFSNLRQ